MKGKLNAVFMGLRLEDGLSLLMLSWIFFLPTTKEISLSVPFQRKLIFLNDFCGMYKPL